MNGTDAKSGKFLGGRDHLRQSIRDILSTPIGSRVMRRDYGSRLYRLVDAPMNRATVLDLYVATAEALARWEPRIDVESVSASEVSRGRIVLSLFGRYRPGGDVVMIDGIEVT